MLCCAAREREIGAIADVFDRLQLPWNHTAHTQRRSAEERSEPELIAHCLRFAAFGQTEAPPTWKERRHAAGTAAGWSRVHADDYGLE